MSESFEKYKDWVDFLIVRIGLPAVILGFVLWFHFHEFVQFKRDVFWFLMRANRNERAIMQKIGVALILDEDQKK